MNKPIGNQAEIMRSIPAREQDIILLVSEGLSNKETDRRLGIGEGTVKVHRHNIYNKIGIANRTVLAAFAISHHDFGP
jgi:two-component system nitrate/nitrite response regulator NarL